MAEQFLTLMADLDAETQRRMGQWYLALREAGFTGTQTPGLPYHISLATFSLTEEQKAAGLLHKAAAEFPPIPVHISHIGIFAPGKVLFAAPERTWLLDALHDACDLHASSQRPWTPHATLLIDEPGTVCAALPVLARSFQPLMATVTRLHLCAFWPTREIAAAALTGIDRQEYAK